MKQIKIRISLTETELQRELLRFHFSKEDLSMGKKVYSDMSKLTIYAYYENIVNTENTPDYDYVMCVTMGPEMDSLMDSYLSEEKLSLGYISHCLCMLFLEKAYQKAINSLEVQEHVSIQLHTFAGENDSLSDLSLLLSLLPGCGVHLSDQRMMIPSKSALLLLKKTQDGACTSFHNTNSCVMCKNPCQFYHTD